MMTTKRQTPRKREQIIADLRQLQKQWQEIEPENFPAIRAALAKTQRLVRELAIGESVE